MRRYWPPSRRLRSSASRTRRTRSTSVPSVSSRTSIGGGKVDRGADEIGYTFRPMAVLRAGIDLGGAEIQSVAPEWGKAVTPPPRRPTPTAGGAEGGDAWPPAASAAAATPPGSDPPAP